MIPTGEFINILRKVIKSSGQNGDRVLLSEENRHIMRNLLQQIRRVLMLEAHALDFQVEFGKSVLNMAEAPPLEVVWWLQSVELIYLNTYIHYNFEESSNVAEQIVDLLCVNDVTPEVDEPSIETSPARVVARDMLIELWIASEGPTITFSKESFSKWAVTSHELVDSIINQCVSRFLESDKKPCNYLKDVRATGKLSESILRKINLHHLRLILRYKPSCAMDAVLHQSNWTCKNSHLNFVSILTEIFCNIQNPMQQILEVLDEDVICWESFLTAISVCLKVHPESALLLKATVDDIIPKALIASSSDKLITAFLMARQACHESANKFESYGSWYSKQFGPDSTSKTATKKEVFRFFIKFLTDLVPYEPESCLQVHIAKSLATPPRCMSMVKEFKDVARSRTTDFKIKQDTKTRQHVDEDEVMIID